jgi:hypothetical protein
MLSDAYGGNHILFDDPVDGEEKKRDRDDDFGFYLIISTERIEEIFRAVPHDPSGHPETHNKP